MEGGGWVEGLFEIHADGLVEKAALEVLVLGLFTKALEAEEAGGVAFLDGDLEIAGGVEQGELFAFVDIGVGLADLIDRLVAFKDDAEAAAFALFLEFVAGDIHDHVLEIIDKDDLSFDPVIAETGAEMVFFDKGRVGLADIEEGGAGGEGPDGLSHHAGAVEGIADRGLVEGQADHHLGTSFEDHGEEAVIGAADILFVMEGEEELFGSSFEKVHEDDMVGKGGEVLEGVAADIGGLGVVEGREGVGNIEEGEPGIDLDQLAFDCAHEIILFSDIRGKGDDCHYLTSSPFLKKKR